MERKVGEIFYLENNWYQVFKDDCDKCNKCVFYNGGETFCSEEKIREIIGKCSRKSRNDKTSVFFKKIPNPLLTSTCNKKKLLLII